MFGYIEKDKLIALLDKEIEELTAKHHSSAEELIRYSWAGLGKTPMHDFVQKECNEYIGQLDEAYKLRELIEKEVV